MKLLKDKYNKITALKRKKKELRIDEWSIPTKDSDGGTHRIYSSIPMSLFVLINDMVQSGKPFKSQGRLVRWCLHEGMKWLAQDDTKLKEAMDTFEDRTMHLQQEREGVLLNDTVRSLMAIVREREMSGHMAEAKSYATWAYNKALKQANGGSYWAERLVEEMRTSLYKYLPRRVDLTTFDESEEED